MPRLPSEPSIRNLKEQSDLTVQYLIPVIDELEICLKSVRREVDVELIKKKPMKLGKPYPLGQCLEITQAVERCLKKNKENCLPVDAIPGLRALRAFLHEGGEFRRVWGDLCRQYFQNAFQIGSLYVDVANDTVDPAKPKVEILPFEQADLVPIRNYEHFGEIASRYWGDYVYPNHVLPSLAPYCPLIHVNQSSCRIKLQSINSYMLGLTKTGAFTHSEQALRKKSMPRYLFKWIQNTLRGSPHLLSISPEEGRQLSLENCEKYRQGRWHHNEKVVNQIGATVVTLNRQLTQQAHFYDQQDIPMTDIRIDNVDYDLDSLSAEANAQLQNIQFVDQELARLQSRIAAMQTARNAYIQALKAALPPTNNARN